MMPATRLRHTAPGVHFSSVTKRGRNLLSNASQKTHGIAAISTGMLVGSRSVFGVGAFDLRRPMLKLIDWYLRPPAKTAI
jgi:hypothetical protein